MPAPFSFTFLTEAGEGRYLTSLSNGEQGKAGFLDDVRICH